MALRRETATRPAAESLPASSACALGGIRTPNLLIRSQMLYPLSYERLDNDEQEYTRGALAGQSAPAARSADPPAPLVGPLRAAARALLQEAETVAGSWPKVTIC